MCKVQWRGRKMRNENGYFASFFSLSQLEAEAVPDVSEKYEITSVPTFVFFKVWFHYSGVLSFIGHAWVIPNLSC